jgi:hypothetical protein
MIHVGTQGIIVGFDGKTIIVEFSSPNWMKNVVVDFPISMGWALKLL